MKKKSLAKYLFMISLFIFASLVMNFEILNAEENGDDVSCPAGKYYNPSTSDCKSCPTGYTSAGGEIGVGKCYMDIPAGHRMQEYNGSSYIECGRGYYKDASRYYYNTPAQACERCPEGQTTNTTTASSVSQCITPSDSCASGQYYNTSTSDCKTCPTGYTSAAGEVGVERCYMDIPAGYRMQQYNGGSYIECGKGYYRSASRYYYNSVSQACTQCPDGMTTNTTTATSYSQCVSSGSNPSGGGLSTTYTITADANGGTIKTPITTGWTIMNNSDNKKATKDVSSGSTYGTLPEVTKTDDTLKEWNTKADGTGIKVTSTTTAGETRTIYAIWNSVVTTITGITISPKPAEVEVGKTIQLTAVVTPSTANQTVNWSSSNPSIASVDNNGVVTGKVIGTVTITATTQDGTKSDTAQVTVKAEGSGTTTHNITFNCNGGTGTMESKSVNFGQTITLPTNSCARIGYTFSGWNTSSNGSGTAYADGATIDYTLNDNLELFAQWTRNSNTYVIHYDANGGTGTMTDTAATVDVEGTLKANTFKYSGHTFDGWKAYHKDSNGNWTPLKKDNKEVELKNKAKFTNLMGPNEEEVTLFAQWKVVNPKTGIVTPTAIIGGLLLISAFGYYLVKKKNIVLE